MTEHTESSQDEKTAAPCGQRELALLADSVVIFEMIKEYFIHDCTHWSIANVVDKPKGQKQPSDIEIFDHEYIDQRSGCEGDCVDGEAYFPLPDGRYLQVYYAS